MTRVTELGLARIMVGGVTDNREGVAKYSEEISSGYKVSVPGDSNESGTISQFRGLVQRIEGYRDRAATVKSYLYFQDDALNQAHELLVRAKEIATQGANETNGPANRLALSQEVFQLRDHMVSIANSTYQGRYVWGGADDDDPPFDALTYNVPTTGPASQRYVWDNVSGNFPGHDVTTSVNVTDNLTITLNTPADDVFQDAIVALEVLGRALAGYATNLSGGLPDGTGNAYTFPTDFSLQTDRITDAIDLLDTARENDIITERTSIGGRMKRVETAEALLDLSRSSAQGVLDRLQNADYVESSTNLTQAQNALQASLLVTSKVLRELNIMDFI